MALNTLSNTDNQQSQDLIFGPAYSNPLNESLQGPGKHTGFLKRFTLMLHGTKVNFHFLRVFENQT